MRAQPSVTIVIAKDVGNSTNRKSKTSILLESYGICPTRLQSCYAPRVPQARARSVCGPVWPRDAGNKSHSQSSALLLPGRSKNVSHRSQQEVVDAMTANITNKTEAPRVKKMYAYNCPTCAPIFCVHWEDPYATQVT